MENTNQKWVNLSFTAAAVLLGYIVSSFLAWASGTFDLEAKFRYTNQLIIILPIVIGFGLFLSLYFNSRSNTFTNEVVAELIRVTWPGRRETTSGTIVVIVMVVVTGFLLAFVDYLWTQLVQWILK